MAKSKQTFPENNVDIVFFKCANFTKYPHYMIYREQRLAAEIVTRNECSHIF